MEKKFVNMTEKRKKVLTIEPDKIPEGTCVIKESLIDNNDKFCICKEEGKIKIFPVYDIEKEEK